MPPASSSDSTTTPGTPEPSDGSTTQEVVDRYRSDGYEADLFAVEGGTIRCGSCRAESPAADVAADSVRRLEGASDPDDMQAVIAATCPSCGTRGLLVVHYGPTADGADMDVLLAIDDQRGRGTERGGAPGEGRE